MREKERGDTMTLDISRAEIARRYNEERKGNRLASCNKFGFGLVYSNAEIREKVLGDLFARYAWPGGYQIIFITHDGDMLCAECARTAVMEGHETLAADIYYEGPVEYCADCNRELEPAYGDPDAEEETGDESCEECAD
jgi:hypothetical protein